jgi:hypothetical protein
MCFTAKPASLPMLITLIDTISSFLVHFETLFYLGVDEIGAPSSLSTSTSPAIAISYVMVSEATLLFIHRRQKLISQIILD